MPTPSTLPREFEVLEQASTRIRATFTEEDGVTPVPGSVLASASMRILAPDPTTILIGPRDILNANNATIDECGVLLLLLSPADMAMQLGTLPNERHLVQFVWTWGTAPVKTGRAEVVLILRNLALVP